MSTERLQAFSDGVIAILITIMVLELKLPDGAEWSSLHPLVPVLLSYVLSFVYLGIYWTNHHHMMHATDRVNGAILWANLHLLFWLSLVPFATRWLGEHGRRSVPTAAYGIVLLFAGVAYYVLQRLIMADQGEGSRVAIAVGRDLKGKLSPVLYLVGIALTAITPWLADVVYVIVALMWLIPDRRIAAQLSRESRPEPG
jgi:uncharacterized membrane protein